MKSDFDAVGDFHKKFDLPNATHTKPAPKEIDANLRDFRLKFILEELEELCEGYGLRLKWEIDAPDKLAPENLPKIADALIDLSYVVLGTAHVHGLPWQALFNEVQRANITKERCGIDHHFVEDGITDFCNHPLDESTVCGKARVAHSLRGSAHDVIKPEGWTAPDIIGVLMAHGWPGPPLPLKEE